MKKEKGKLEKMDVLPRVHAILSQKYGELVLVAGQGITRGERVKTVKDGKLFVIKTSTGGRISFGRKGAEFPSLSEADFVVVVAPTAFEGNEYEVSLYQQSQLLRRFQLNEQSQQSAGMDLPNWIAPFHEEGRGARGVGDGFGEEALWTEPLYSKVASSVPAPNDQAEHLTIPEAKRRLSQSLNVPVEAIEIIIRA